MQATQWARLRSDAEYQLRRGAWYRVLRLTPLEAVLDVNQKQVSVPRAYLQVVPGRPERWSVVPRPRNSVRLPATWGSRYAVCPNCRARAPLGRPAVTLRCPKCNGVFDVGWDQESP